MYKGKHWVADLVVSLIIMVIIPSIISYFLVSALKQGNTNTCQKEYNKYNEAITNCNN